MTVRGPSKGTGRRWLLAGAVFALLVAAPPQALAGSTCLGADETIVDAEMTPAAERTLLCLVNLHRRDHGIGPVALEPALAAAAGGHSQDMVIKDFFDHTNPETGSTPQDRAGRAGYPGAVGENIAFTSIAASPRYMFELWRESPGHNENMLRPEYTVGGMGLEVGWPDQMTGVPDEGVTGTQVFGIEPTARATDTALDLVVSEECAQAQAELPPLEAEVASAKEAQKRAAGRVASKRRKLDAAETPAEIEEAKAELKRARAELKAARAETRVAKRALNKAATKASAACA